VQQLEPRGRRGPAPAASLGPAWRGGHARARVGRPADRVVRHGPGFPLRSPNSLRGRKLRARSLGCGVHSPAPMTPS
jgi:hypothetical protein